MKRSLCILYLLLISICFVFGGEIETQRIYCNRIISFHRVYDIYFTQQRCGYYKYPKEIGGQQCYLTYEGADFYEKCTYDSDMYLVSQNIPMNIYTNSQGEVMRFKKKFGPVIDKNRKRKNYPYGYGQNYGGHFVNP